MGYSCNNQCAVYQKHWSPIMGSHYKLGFKRCSVCDKFIVWDGVYCPCCGARLGIKPKTKNGLRYKSKIIEVFRY